MYGSVNFVRKTLQVFNEQICQSWGFSTCAVQRVAGHLAEIFHSMPSFCHRLFNDFQEALEV